MRRIWKWILVGAVYVFIPIAMTMLINGQIDSASHEICIYGPHIEVKYKHATEEVSVNDFVKMVLAARYQAGNQIETLKAESVMIRTDIKRIMNDEMSIDSNGLGMKYMTENEMKKAWGDDYESIYELISDCVNITGAETITYNGMNIDAMYMEVSNGKTGSGKNLLGDNYAYLKETECPEDIKSDKYLSVYTFSDKDLCRMFDNQELKTGIDKDTPSKDIQIISRSDNGYVLKVQVGNALMSGMEFAEKTGINTPCFVFENSDNGLKITAYGRGSGFGVSLYTSDIMAEAGNYYKDIISSFYEGVEISEWDDIE